MSGDNCFSSSRIGIRFTAVIKATRVHRMIIGGKGEGEGGEDEGGETRSNKRRARRRWDQGAIIRALDDTNMRVCTHTEMRESARSIERPSIDCSSTISATRRGSIVDSHKFTEPQPRERERERERPLQFSRLFNHVAERRELASWRRAIINAFSKTLPPSSLNLSRQMLLIASLPTRRNSRRGISDAASQAWRNFCEKHAFVPRRAAHAGLHV
jgi:hypothetical protein